MVKIASQPVGASAVVGSPASLSVTLTADSTIVPQYQWYRNNVPVQGANRPNLGFASVSTLNAGTYHVQISAGATKLNSSAVRLTVGQAVCN